MRTLLVLLSVALLDLGVRFLAPWSFQTVLVVEGLLFLAGCVAVVVLERTVRDASARGRWLRRGMAALLGLGALRSLAWGLGAPVTLANGLTLAAGLVLAFLWWRRRRRTAP